MGFFCHQFLLEMCYHGPLGKGEKILHSAQPFWLLAQRSILSTYEEMGS